MAPINLDDSGIAMKGEGNRLFQAGKFREAILKYEESVPIFQESNDNQELSKVYGNMAECYLRLNGSAAFAAAAEDDDQKYVAAALAAATKSLEYDASNPKALYRRARARMEAGDFRGAMTDGDESGARDGIVLATRARTKFNLYSLIIDSYRLRMEENYTHTGDIDSGSLYAGEVGVPARHFGGYLKLGLAQEAFPGKFTSGDVDCIVKMAQVDAWHNIKFAVELSDVQKRYAELGKSKDVAKLRVMAKKAMGPIGSYFSASDVEERCIRDYMSDSEGSDYEERDDDFTWMYKPPFSPYRALIDGGDPDFSEDCMMPFVEKFGAEYPAQYPRLSMDIIYNSGVSECGIHDSEFVAILLQKKFGQASNGLTPEQFSSKLKEVMFNHHDRLSEQAGWEKLDKAQPATGPSDWHFDHYGTLCSLVLVAYNLLTEEEQCREDVQTRLARVLLSGDEEILTGSYTCQRLALGGDSFGDLSHKNWEGPMECQTMPQSWNEGEGNILLHKSWEVWQSIVQARKGLGSVHSKPAAYPSLIDETANIIGLQCFSKRAIRSLADRYDHAPWDANCGVINMYCTAVAIAIKACLDSGNVERASELAKEGSHLQYLYQNHNCSIEKYVDLRTAEIHSLIVLKRKRSAEKVLQQIQRCVKIEGKRSMDPSLLAKKLKDFAGMVDAMANGPVPKRTPTSSKKLNVWHSFDASTDEEVRGAVARYDRPTVGLWWLDNNKTSYPNVIKLHLRIGEQTGLDGLSNLFPNLTHLVIDDSKECLRTSHDLSELPKYASTLEYLELRLSFQWMAEGDDDVLEPMASLVNLRELRLERRRDGAPHEFKFLESLEKLERLHYWGTNGLDFYGSDFDPSYGVIDLSSLKKLSSVVFLETSFCHITENEKGDGSQALVLPSCIQKVACIDFIGSRWSRGLLKNLTECGVMVYHQTDIWKEKEKTRAMMWKDIQNLFGSWSGDSFTK